jgi:ElaB/YqjD/DUF883 family membrane-anchored ribosome-binding protein
MTREGSTAADDQTAGEAELDELRQRISALHDDVSEADKRIRAVLRERPFIALGGAVLVGFVLGRIIGRS